MANISILAPWILSFEGGYSNHPLDKGGPTNRGVTLSTWRSVGHDLDADGDIDSDDVRLITDRDMISCVLRPHYWNRWKADAIRSQSIANIVVDWVWASGRPGISEVQRILGVTPDGVVGPKTLQAVNSADPVKLFDRIKGARLRFIADIMKRSPSQKVFLKGWTRRIESIGYGWLIDNRGRKISFPDHG